MTADPMVSYSEYQAVVDDYAASEREVRRLRRHVTQLQRELNDQREDSPRAKEIREVLDHYVVLFGKTKAFKVGPETERWKDVDTALKTHTVQELKEALDGLHAMPYVGLHGRQPNDGPGAERHDEIDIAIRNEKHVDRFRGYVAKAQRIREREARKLEAKRPARESDWSYDRMEAEWDPVDAQVRAMRHFEPDPVTKVLEGLARNGLSYRVSGPADWMAQCPAHEDRDPSLHLRWAAHEGKLLLHCHAGCEVVYVMDALGLSLADLFERHAA